MERIWLPAIVAVMVFIVFLLLLPKRISSEEERRKRSVLDQMSEEAQRSNPLRAADINLLKERMMTLPTAGIAGFLSKLPGIQSTLELLLKAGLVRYRVYYLIGSFLLFYIMFYAFHGMGPLGFICAIAITFYGPRKYLQHVIAKRNDKFIDLFPDAVDMIVRSVRSGHPLNTALRMISENMENPIRDEFKQVVDEVSYGRSLPEALIRMSQRIDEQDLHFFVVVLSVQQETGGSLAEVLTNLSSVIRKRRQLRLKIRALTSEGRATSYVLGALPVVEFGLILWIAPGYIQPLFDTLSGNIILAIAMILVVSAVWIVRVMVDIDI